MMPSITCEHCGSTASTSDQKFCEECGADIRELVVVGNEDSIREEIDSDPEVKALKEKLAEAEKEAEKRAEEKRREEEAILKQKEEKERIEDERKATESEITRLKNELSLAEKRLQILIEEGKNTGVKGACYWQCGNCDAAVERTAHYCTACNSSFSSTIMYCTSCGSGQHSRINAVPAVGVCNICGHKFSWKAPRTPDGKCPKCLKFPSGSST